MTMESFNLWRSNIWPCGLFGFVYFLCFVNGSLSVDYFKEKPSYIKTCKIYEPEFTKCSTESIQKFLTMTFGGKIPEVTALVGSLDPLKLDKLNFNQNNNEAASLKATLTDMLATGLSNIQIKESKVSKKDFGWLTKIFVPKFKLDGHYKMDGRILLLPLSGEGHMVIEIDGMDITMRTKTHLIETGGFTFYNVTDIKVELDIHKLTSQFDNLFGGNNKEVERSTNESFNKNWRDFFEALRPLITKTVNNIMDDVMHKLFLLYPANFFVGDIPTSQKLYGPKEKKDV